MARPFLLPVVLLLSACAAGDSLRGASGPVAAEAQPAAMTPPDTGPLPTPGGRTPEALDTTTEAERQAALTVAPAAERELGRAIASLGPPGEQGIWLQTPLVSEVTQGRVVWTRTGADIAVELRPADDASGATQISLAALRLLEAPLTALPELIIYAR